MALLALGGEGLDQLLGVLVPGSLCAVMPDPPGDDSQALPAPLDSPGLL